MAPVVLVHGFLVGPWSMLWLDRQLRQHGFPTHRFEYSSRRLTLTEAASELLNFCQRIDSESCHLVAHSLGGLVALEMLQARESGGVGDVVGGGHVKYPLPPGRLVLLGTPVKGASAAVGLGRFSWGERLLGQARVSLSRSFLSAPEGWPTTVIAGTQALGLGRVFSPLPIPNDGTVAVAETTLEKAHCVQVKASHSGLLFSPQVVKQTLQALQG